MAARSHPTRQPRHGAATVPPSAATRQGREPGKTTRSTTSRPTRSPAPTVRRVLGMAGAPPHPTGFRTSGHREERPRPSSCDVFGDSSDHVQNSVTDLSTLLIIPSPDSKYLLEARDGPLTIRRRVRRGRTRRGNLPCPGLRAVGRPEGVCARTRACATITSAAARPRLDRWEAHTLPGEKRRSRRLLATTSADEAAMAAAANKGFSNPSAASGRATTL